MPSVLTTAFTASANASTAAYEYAENWSGVPPTCFMYLTKLAVVLLTEASSKGRNPRNCTSPSNASALSVTSVLP